MPSRARFIPMLPVALLLAALSGVSAPKAWGHSAAGRIEKVVAAADRLAVLAGSSITLIDENGLPVGRCGRFEAPAARRERERVGTPDADEVLAAAGMSDDDDSSDAEDALEDEGLGHLRRRRPTADAPPLPRDLAAGTADDAIWIATSAGLYLESGGACVKAGLPGRDLIAVGAGDGIVAGASETLLWRFDVSTGSAAVAGGLPERPRALAVGEGGRILVADDDGVLDVRPGARPVRILDRPAEALAFCNGALLVLADDGTYLERGSTLDRVGERPPVRTVACGWPDGPRFIGAGVGVWTTMDGGTWIEQRGGLGRSVSAVAAGFDRIWMAVDGELVALDEARPRLADANATPVGLVLLTARSPRTRPSFPLPRLTVALAAERTPVRIGWSVFVLLTFPLGRRVAAGPGPAELGTALLRRDAELAAERIALGAQPSDDETAARARALEQERFALR